MSILNEEHTERVVARDAVQLWDAIERDWAGSNEQRWKTLACIHLRLHSQWSLETIGLAFGHHRGHVLRLINDGLRKLRAWDAGLEHFGDNEQELSLPYRMTVDEIARRRSFFLDEANIWTALFEQARDQASRQESAITVRRQIIPGSLREQVAAVLKQIGPAKWQEVADHFADAVHRVRQVLLTCPEFVCEYSGLWTVHPFDGQETEGVDTKFVECDAKEVPA